MSITPLAIAVDRRLVDVDRIEHPLGYRIEAGLYNGRIVTAKGWTRSIQATAEWHEIRSRRLQRLHPDSWSEVVDRRSHPDFVRSPSGGLTHFVEWVQWQYNPAGFGDSVNWFTTCGQIRTADRCVPVFSPEAVCHQCHDRHWTMSGEHLPGLPQTGCELTGGEAWVSKRVQAVRARAGKMGR